MPPAMTPLDWQIFWTLAWAVGIAFALWTLDELITEDDD